MGEHSSPSKAPVAKVTAGAAAGAIVVVIVYVGSLFGLDVPAAVAAALTVIAGFGSGYIKAP